MGTEIEYKLRLKSAPKASIFDNPAETIKQGYFELNDSLFYLDSQDETLQHPILSLLTRDDEVLHFRITKTIADKISFMFNEEIDSAYRRMLKNTNGVVVRVRTTLNRFGKKSSELTLKCKKNPESAGSIVRFEFDIPIDNEHLLATLFYITKSSTIEKTRYLFYFDVLSSLKWEIDIFHGKHEGLVIAEIEVPNEATLMPPPPASWEYEDVSRSKKYMNGFLAFMPFSYDTYKINHFGDVSCKLY